MMAICALKRAPMTSTPPDWLPQTMTYMTPQAGFCADGDARVERALVVLFPPPQISWSTSYCSSSIYLPLASFGRVLINRTAMISKGELSRLRIDAIRYKTVAVYAMAVVPGISWGQPAITLLPHTHECSRFENDVWRTPKPRGVIQIQVEVSEFSTLHIASSPAAWYPQKKGEGSRMVRRCFSIS